MSEFRRPCREILATHPWSLRRVVMASLCEPSPPILQNMFQTLATNDAVPLTTGAHNAFLSAFFAAGGVFDHLVDTCPLKLTSNNAPTNRETLGTAVVGMTNGSYRYRHFDNLSGDAVTAELFGIRRLMSCDSVRRNLKAIPMAPMRKRPFP